MALEAASQSVSVKVAPAYPVVIGAGVLSRAAEFISERRVAIISNDTVFDLYGQALVASLEAANKQVVVLRVADSEKSKSLPVFASLLSECALAGLDRGSAVVALGGGVIGDLAGFVAASYMRGIAFYQLPTTLLAMVDASVGGKTGVNLPEGKNLVGAFKQPRAVLMDVLSLRSLPETLFKQGAVELFKHGLLADASILDDMTATPLSTQSDSARLTDLITRSVQVKADIVAQDETEQGVRAFLNLGHNTAHALEAVSNNQLSHGEAVTYGLYFSSRLSAHRNYQDYSALVKRFFDWVKPSPLPTRDFSQLESFLKRDKKNMDGVARFVLLKALGEPVLVDDVSSAELERAWQDVLALA